MDRKLLVLIGCLLTSTVNATVISHHGYELNSDSNVVIGGGLEWLRWDQTFEYSIEIALQEYASRGWMLASENQMVNLFNAFGFGADVPWIVDNDHQLSAHEPYANTDTTSADFFQALFGINFVQEGSGYGVGEDRLSGSWAFYGSDIDGDQRYNSAEVYSAMTMRRNTGFPQYEFFGPYLPQDAQAFLTPNSVNRFERGANSVALVRQITTVPLPNTVWLIGSALLSLFAASVVSINRPLNITNFRPNPLRRFLH